MTHDQNQARLETLLRENDLSLAHVSVAIGRNKTYLQQYLRRGMPAVLTFQDTETLGRLLGCDPSALRHDSRLRLASLVAVPEITVNARAHANTIAEACAAPQSALAPSRTFPALRGRRPPGRRVRPQYNERGHAAQAPTGRSHRRSVDTSRRWPTHGELFVLWDGNSMVIKRYGRVYNSEPPTRSGSTPTAVSTRPTPASQQWPVLLGNVLCGPDARRDGRPSTQPVLLDRERPSYP